MVCPSCSLPSHGLCDGCRSTLRPAGDCMVDDLVARAAFHHSGAAASLIHQLKYRRCTGAVDVLADAMARVLRPDACALVPVPRGLVRRISHGIDPAAELTAAVHRRTGVPVRRLLTAPVVWSRHAGRPRSRRSAIPFGATPAPPGHTVLIDDVLTTGQTAVSAAKALRRVSEGGPRPTAPSTISLLAATAAGTMDPGAIRPLGR